MKFPDTCISTRASDFTTSNLIVFDMALIYKTIQEELHSRLKKSGWAEILEDLILGDIFSRVLETLYTQRLSGTRFTPKISELFRAFEECPYDKTKVVIVGQDPYPSAEHADGIAFSTKSTKHPTSLRVIHKEIENTVGYSSWVLDLKSWSNQGVLLINTAFTVAIAQPGSHTEIWRKFVEELFEILNLQENLIFVFMGRVARGWEDKITNSQRKYFVSHPASAAYNGTDIWDSKNVFNEINKLITPVIKW